MAVGFYDLNADVEANDLVDWQLPVAFDSKRHTEKIAGCISDTETWRMKDRMKTVSVALVLCLNVGVDPPDVVKTQPCARLECWIDPLSFAPQKALETIATNLQKQYERWQPRARYKHSLDPTVDEVKRLCTSLRRNAKDERVLFHYNGHGVPKPTANGEIWVFNKTYTQYIPLSIYDLQQWMGSPSVFVYDCSCAGLIVESFNQFALQHEREFELLKKNSKPEYEGPPMPCYKSCIQLAACDSQQILPMNPDLPADLFTSCLTTPVKVALKWFVLQNTRKLVPGITMEAIEKIPGMLNDRRTMLGELNWVFTAITDTIAWNVLPKDMFHRLFRQDLLVASLFRNFLLAERVMRSYNCNPVSYPSLPSTYHHPMWQAWDLAVDICLAQLPAILKEGAPYVNSPFFSEQLTAFQVWLSFGFDGRSVPEQLPIVLQVLLSQVHRLRALELLGRFLDLGPWAVNLALSVGIFPYVLKLLQSSARELRPLLAFIWAKVLAVDDTCQNDLVRDGGYKYFLSVLGEPYMPAEHRTMAAFSISCIIKEYPAGQVAALQGNVISLCLEQLTDTNARLRQWAAICLGRMWCNFEQARWCGVRDSAHEKLYLLLSDPVPEVRAAAVYALGTFLSSSTERTEHANTIDHNIGMTLLNTTAADGSPLVRMELVVALQWFLLNFENQFTAVSYQLTEKEKMKEGSTPQHLLPPGGEVQQAHIKKVSSRDKLKSGSPVSSFLDTGGQGDGILMVPVDRMRRVSSSTSICSMASTAISPVAYSMSTSLGYASVFTNIWKALIGLQRDPFPSVAELAGKATKYIREKAEEKHRAEVRKDKVSSVSEPSSPSGKPNFLGGESPPTHIMHHTQESNKQGGTPRWLDNRPSTYQQCQYFAQFHRIRKTFDKGPEVHDIGEDGEDAPKPRKPIVTTAFVDWCAKYFSQPMIKLADNDTNSEDYQTKEWRFIRNENIRKCIVDEQRKLEHGKMDEQVFINKNPNLPTILRMHPYEPHLVVADKSSYSAWDWEKGCMLSNNSTNIPSNCRITATDFINAHNETLLMTASDDGVVKVWRNYTTEPEAKLVTAFQMVQDMLPSNRGSGLVLRWEQHSCQLIASGDVKVIRIWDAEREAKVHDIPTGAESCITCLTSDQSNPHIVVAGCGDGTVRTYDRRLPANESRFSICSEHSAWVVNVSLQDRAGHGGQIVSGSVAGDVRFWDLRSNNATNYIPPSHGMTAMAVHPTLDLIACGTASQFISLYNHQGESVGTIKYLDGFMGHRMGPVSCVAFHPYKVNLAAGSTDALISVYSVSRK